MRDPYSTTWFDYDLSLGISFPGAFANTDFDNHGDPFAPTHASANNFLNLDVGATVQVGAFGAAATGDLEQVSLTTAAPDTAGLRLQIGRWKALGAVGLLAGQLVVGGGARVITMQMLPSGGGTLLTMTGAAPEVGALVMPTGRPWRIGFTVRAPVAGGILGRGEDLARDADGTRRVGHFVLPSRIVMPWEGEVGVAYQLGPRPLNPGWPNPHVEEARLRAEVDHDRAERRHRYEDDLARLSPAGRAARAADYEAEERSLRGIEDEHLDEERRRLHAARQARYENWPREKILLLASVLATGAVTNATSLEGFVDQRLEPAGRQVTFTPRLGLEAEPIQNRMLLRTGTYVEPSRYDGGTARQHFTFGTDVRLFPLDFWGLLPPAIWKLELFADIAPRYTNWGIGIGNWH